ncbi:saponin hydrolase precursor [Aaosphaeria arxii CBS 175.79]|uniref:Saponin hydrolase n=1 Tax=Aaosphaeria arxii CBS 175.79 TaxID=1450172 RepID=A0A6A5XMP9_9PLEO|nr:saponin hydrolase precursor [Aaosphaeria arxii CBS 175.79]KAF2014223.1 saponin hydrolase precursor [Aaosphaeria arxii CBS 175.79]
MSTWNVLQTAAGILRCWMLATGCQEKMGYDVAPFPTDLTYTDIPPPPAPEPISLRTLPLPPSIASDEPGSCNSTINPHGTGCMVMKKGFQAGDFLPDGAHVLARVTFTGAPLSPSPGSIYTGEQVIIIKTDGSLFPNGDAWKCITCGLPSQNTIDMIPGFHYPQSFRDSQRLLIGSNILTCTPFNLTDPQCTPSKTHIYPVRWNNPASNGFGAIRELRLHPDNAHIGFSAFTLYEDKTPGQLCYYARLEFNPSDPHPGYDLTNVTTLLSATGPKPYSISGRNIHIDSSALAIGELRGFTPSGDEVIYIGPPTESSNVDVFAAHLRTGAVRRLTSHPDYCDPITYSPSGDSMVVMDTRASGRMMWASGMRSVPPLIDLVTLVVAAGLRNNGQRRFFQPWLLDRWGDRGTYYGQQVNAKLEGRQGTPGSGAFDDPEWNSLADPRWSLDSTQLVYAQAQTTYPECGGENPLPCYESKEPFGRRQRLVVATFTGRKPRVPATVEFDADEVVWGTKYVPGEAPKKQLDVPGGRYILEGKTSGYADVEIGTGEGGGSVKSVEVVYHNFTDDGRTFLNGRESAKTSQDGQGKASIWWFSDLAQSGETVATKRTGDAGLKVNLKIFDVSGWEGSFETTVDGVTHVIPDSGT